MLSSEVGNLTSEVGNRLELEGVEPSAEGCEGPDSDHHQPQPARKRRASFSKLGPAFRISIVRRMAQRRFKLDEKFKSVDDVLRVALKVSPAELKLREAEEQERKAQRRAERQKLMQRRAVGTVRRAKSV